MRPNQGHIFDLGKSSLFKITFLRILKNNLIMKNIKDPKNTIPTELKSIPIPKSADETPWGKSKVDVIILFVFLPNPKNLSIIREQNEIAEVENLKIFLDITKFYSLDQIAIKDLVFKKTDFNIKISDLIFFKKLLTTEPNDNKIVFKNSNLFFRSNNDEILFLNKIYDSKF